MTSLTLSILLLFCVLFALVSQIEGDRLPSRNRKVSKDKNVSVTPTASDDDDADGDNNDVLVSAGDADQGVARRRPGRKNKGETRGSRGGKRPDRRRKQGRRGGRVKSKRRQLKEKKAETVLTMGNSIDAFSISLYKQMTEEHPDNFVFSPFSVFSALSMLHLGASGRTKAELTTGLSITSPVHTAIKNYNKTLDQGADDDTVLALANNVYYRSGLKLHARFVQKLLNFYGATAEPFKDTKPEEAINDWVEEKTKGEIKDFLSPGSIPLSVQAMLINAVYFKGVWNSKFDADNTEPLPFYVTPSESVNTESMRQTGYFRVSRSNSLGATILELPYVGDEFALFLIQPNTNLSDVESKLTADLLKAEISDTIQTPVNNFDVQLPKFGLDTKEEMKEMLKRIGITEVFDASKASFKKLTRERKVSVDEVIHRAVIEVDEEGTVAAAVTGIGVFMSARVPEVKVDRPFMFVLRDKVYGINLFIGRYTNPEGANLKD